MKKFLSLALAVVMVLSMAVTAFAVSLQNADSMAVAETSVLNAMYAAGILKGDGGKAPSSSATLTRWQVALIALRVYTLIDLDPRYDLDDENWADYVVEYGDKEVVYEDCEYPSALGAILFVQEKGFIKGYAEDDKTFFRPAQPVTYAEALTIMVRILGWDSKAMNSNWPYNYVEQAAKLGLTSGITKIGMDDQVTYGVMAQLILNTLNAKRYFSVDALKDLASLIQNGTTDASAAVEAILSKGVAIDPTDEDNILANFLPVGDAQDWLDYLATSLLIFGYFDADGEFVRIDDEGNPDDADFAYTLVNGVGKIGNYIYDKTGKSGAEFDLGYISYDEMDGYLEKNQNPKVYINGENIIPSGSDYRVRNWFWYFYEWEYVDGEVVLDESTRTAALTHNQTRNPNGFSANAWYMQKTPTKNIAMVYEPMQSGEGLVVVNVEGDIYFAHLSGDALDAYAEAAEDAYGELAEEKLAEMLADEEIVNKIKTAANVYFRQGTYYGGGNWEGDPYSGLDESIWSDPSHINAWSLNRVLDLLGLNEFIITADENAELVEIVEYDYETESGYWTSLWEDDSVGGLDGLAVGSVDKMKKLFTIGNDWSDYMFETFSEPSGIYDWAVEKALDVYYGDEIEVAAAKAGEKAIAADIKAVLGTIKTDVDGKEFLGWSQFVLMPDLMKAKVKNVGEERFPVFAVNALYEDDQTKVEWVGAENALGSYVVKTEVKNGFVTTTEYANGFFALDEIPANYLSATVEFVGVCNGATYGAWLIDTTGDGLYDVVVYANFVAGLEVAE